MKHKPIIFSGEMVRAILAGKKTQMRMVIKPQIHAGIPSAKYRYDGIQEGMPALELLDERGEPTEKYFSCGKPRYQPGDILWVRETWKPDCHDDDRYYYKANNDREIYPNNLMCWRPSIHMPRQAARIFLRVKDVRVEQVQKITPENCVAEGSVKKPHYMRYGGENCLVIHGRYKKEFSEFWDSLNAKGGYGWDLNPWVWVISFERAKKPEGWPLVGSGKKKKYGEADIKG